jgi:YesN/AraC family two-component response regulator
MLGTRYEEYIDFKNNIPFVIALGIRRSKAHYSPELNWHENLEVQRCRVGEGQVLLDGKIINFARGDIIVANSGVLHHTGTENLIEYDCIILDTEFCRQSGIDVTETRFNEHFDDDEISEIFLEIKKIREKGGIAAIAKQRMLALQLLIRLCEAHTEPCNAPQTNIGAHKTVTDAITYIHQHYSERITLDCISKSIFANKYTLSRIFKKMTGQTVVGYVNGYRCKQATRLIREGYRINESARLCGFSNMSFFTKAFKHYVGCLPSEYKKMTQ